MAMEITASGTELDMALPLKSTVTGRSSSPPPLIDDNSGILEDGEIKEKQDSLHAELQLSSFEYSALQDRYVRLERQHGELQDLASAYSDVIRGLSPTADHAVSIDQLQAEAGHVGLRSKALEADVLRPLIAEAGGLQALISQLNTMTRLISKAGGLRELEQFVSDLRTIRDTLDEIRGSRGLAGLAVEVRDLHQSKQKHDRLAFEVDGPTGLRCKAARYDKLALAFNSLQDTSAFERSSASSPAMNPDRARMISATPLEADPDRDLYEGPPPVAKPNNRTGPNNTPLGALQERLPDSSLKRKDLVAAPCSVPAKRPRVDVGRAAALLQVSLPATTSTRTDPIAGHRTRSSIRAGTASVKARTQAVSVHITDTPQGQSNATNQQRESSCLNTQSGISRTESGSAKTDIVSSGCRGRNAPLTPQMPDWERSDARFGYLGFASNTGGPRYTSTPLALDTEPSTDASLGPGSLYTDVSSITTRSSQMSGTVDAAQPALQSIRALPVNPNTKQKGIWVEYLKHEVAFWVGDSHANAAWEAYQLLDLKRGSQIPGDLGAYFSAKLMRFIWSAQYYTDEVMAPNHGTCILGYLIDGYGPSEVPQERTACRLCTQHRRPCALMQEIDSRQIIVLMPLRAEFRPGRLWSEEAFWIQDVQETG